MSKISAVIQKMKIDAEYKKYFFRKSPSYQQLYLWLKPLYEEGYFIPENIPRPIEDKHKKGYFSIPQWEVLDFLEAVAIQNRDEHKEETTQLLLEIIDAIIIYQSEENRVDNYRVDWYAVKILFMLPHDKITLEHISFIELSLRRTKFGGLLHSDLGTVVLPVLVENKMKEHLLRLLPILFGYDTKEDSFKIKDREPLVEKYWLYEITKKYPKEIANVVGIDAVKVLLEIMVNILALDKNAFNIVWVSTIENNKQNSSPDRYDNQIVSFVRDMLEEISPDHLESFLESLIYADHMILKRLALHALNYHYESLKSVFWQWFKSENNTLEAIYKHELYLFLYDQANLFTEIELDEVMYWIEGLDYSEYYEDRTPEQIEKITAYRRKEWLLTLKDYSGKAKELYEKYNVLAPEEIEHPGYDLWSSGVRRLDKSPLKDRDAFCSKNVDEILYDITHFDYESVDKDPLINSEDWIEGLARDLGSCIQENPKKFVTELEKFKEIDLVYYYYIFDGLERAWKSKEKFDWQNIFNLIEAVLDDTVLASDKKYAVWVKGKIPELLRTGTASDNHSFDKEYLPQTKKILLDLLNYPEEDDVDINNLLSFSLNASNGKVLHGLMSYALRYGRLHSKLDIKWEEEIKIFFSEQLEKNNNYSLYVFNILGEYLSHIRFLDRQWIEDNIDNIFPIDKDILWQASFMSYVAASTSVYQKDYEYFRDKGHFKKALQHDWRDGHVNEKVLQFMVIAYMNDFDNETVVQIIKEKDLEFNLEIIRFVWHLYRDNHLEKQSKIYKLWETIYALYEGDQSDDMQQIFSTLSKWFVFIEEINETNLNWLKISARYTEINYNSYLIIEQLLTLVEHNAKYVSQVYLSMLDSDVYPTFKEEDIVAIVEKLFKLQEVVNARMICNKYSTKGIYFLNEINKKFKDDVDEE